MQSPVWVSQVVPFMHPPPSAQLLVQRPAAGAHCCCPGSQTYPVGHGWLIEQACPQYLPPPANTRHLAPVPVHSASALHAPQSAVVPAMMQKPLAVSQVRGAVHCPFWQRGRATHIPLLQVYAEGQEWVAEHATQVIVWASQTFPVGRHVWSLLQGVVVEAQLPFRQVWLIGQCSVVEQSSQRADWGLQTLPFAQAPPSPQAGRLDAGKQA
jgi:hypothetical protein